MFGTFRFASFLRRSRLVFSGLLLGLSLIPSPTLAISNRESICGSRAACAGTTCPTGFSCHPELTSDLTRICGSLLTSSGNRCLNDTDISCLSDSSCLDREVTASTGGGATSGPPTCCDCQRTNAGTTVARGFFNIPAPQNCSNFRDNTSVRAGHTDADLAGIACQPTSSCPSPRDGSTLYDTLTPIDSRVSGSANTGAMSATSVPPIIPNLSIPIPGLTFGSIVEQDGVANVPFLSQYVAAVYRYMVGISALVATIMVVYGGFRYLLGSSIGDVQSGRKIIGDAIIGLVILLGGYALLATINPMTLDLVNLRIGIINPPITIYNEQVIDPNDPAPTASSDNCSQGGTATGGLVPGGSNDGFTTIPVHGYFQDAAPWGNLGYSFTTGNLSQHTNPRPCRTASEQNDPSITCDGTIGQGGCGPTTLATILASYNLRVRDPGRGSLCSGCSSAEQPHLFDPIDAAAFAQSIGARASSEVPVIQRDGQWRVALSSEDRANSTARKRVPSGTGPSIFATSRLSRLGNFRSVGWNRSNADNTLVAGGIRQFKAEVIQQVATYLRRGYLAAFLCGGCTVTLNNGRERRYEGHYMVLQGVNADASMFKVFNVGGSRGTNNTITREQLAQNTDGIWVIIPFDGSNNDVSLPAGAIQQNRNLACQTAPASRPVTPANSADIETHTFSWRPPGGSATVYPDNRSLVMYPSALEGLDNPTVHAYIFIPGNNTGTFPSSNRVALENALRSVAGSKNIVVFVAFKSGDYFPNFDLSDFYSTAQTALQRYLPRGFTIADVVVSGHSGATCNGTAPGASGIPLIRAASSPLPGQRAMVAYDGCGGRYLNTSNFTPAGQAIFLNDDQQATAATTHSSFSLTATGCSSCVSTYNAGSQCYSRNEGGRQILAVDSRHGHVESIEPMTKTVFCSLYTNDR